MAEPLKATFFTLKHRDRAVLLPATLVTFVLFALIAGAWWTLNSATLVQLLELIRQMPKQIDEAMGVGLFTGFMGLLLSTLLLMIPLYVIAAVYEAACLRWMIRGEAPGLFGLTLDYDVLRVYGLYWCWLIVQIAVNMIWSILTFPFLFMMMGEVIAQAPTPDAQLPWDLQLKMNALTMLQYIPLAFIAIRFSPAAATSVARRRFSFFEAWKVTEDRFLSLFGSWVVLGIIFGGLQLVLFGAAYTMLMGDLIPRLAAEMPLSEETVHMLFARLLTDEGLKTIGIGYLLGLILWGAHALMSFGVNARAAMVALDEEKITPVPAD